MFQELDVLLIQEGGCAPGYNPVTAFITYHLEAQGRKVYGPREGFKSLVSGRDGDFLQLGYDPDLFRTLGHIPGVFHALHSFLGSRAHLAVLPNSVVVHEKVVEALNKKEECVIVVAEGYKKQEREAKGIKENAAEYFYRELLATKIKIKRKVVCEPFSRDIRGADPNNLDISLAQRMAYNVARYLKAGTSRLIPAVQSGKEYAIPFHEIQTDNMKEKDLLVLSDRLTKSVTLSLFERS